MPPLTSAQQQLSSYSTGRTRRPQSESQGPRTISTLPTQSAPLHLTNQPLMSAYPSSPGACLRSEQCPPDYILRTHYLLLTATPGTNCIPAASHVCCRRRDRSCENCRRPSTCLLQHAGVLSARRCGFVGMVRARCGDGYNKVQDALAVVGEC